MVTISEEEYQRHVDDYDGICLACKEWTVGGVEGDAEDYECEGCGENKVMGVEHALICGEVDIKTT